MNRALWIMICLVAACAAAGLSVFLFNRIPAEWLCDYDEQPGEDLLGVRVSYRTHGAVMALILAAAFLGIRAQYESNPLFITAGCLLSVILLLISISDVLYFIIPDQFVLALLFTALIFSGYDLLSRQNLLHGSWVSPVLGAAGGAGLLLVMGLAGRFFFKKEAMGFGDVKLFAAVGIAAGFPGILFVFLLAIFSALFYIIFLIVFKRKDPKNLSFPFGPFLCLAFLLFLIFHSQINSFAGWYLSLLVR
jgi:prepilin signal peptidase PulO-like enzyme (type II secretory pathway)